MVRTEDKRPVSSENHSNAARRKAGQHRKPFVDTQQAIIAMGSPSRSPITPPRGGPF